LAFGDQLLRTNEPSVATSISFQNRLLASRYQQYVLAKPISGFARRGRPASAALSRSFARRRGEQKTNCFPQSTVQHDFNTDGKRRSSDTDSSTRHPRSLSRPGCAGEEGGQRMAERVPAYGECFADISRTANSQHVFRHLQSEAWQTCHTLLTAPDAPQEARMVAAQTLRSKVCRTDVIFEVERSRRTFLFRLQVVYDVSQLPRESLLPLRDSLLQSLTQYTDPSAPTGSRAIVTQLCLALADLAYQLPEWKDVIAGMVDTFGQRVESVEMLLEFLKVLVEEAGNPRIPLNVSILKLCYVSMPKLGIPRQSAEAADRSSELLSAQREKVLGLLEMYLSAQGESLPCAGHQRGLT
jgi:hypothetical protein